MEQVWCELEDDEEYKNEIRNFQKQKVMVQEDIFQNHIEQKKKEKETEFDVVKEMNKVTTQKELMEINDVENSSFVVIDEPNLDETFESWKDLFEQSNIPLVELNNVEDQISNIEIHEWKSVITDQNFTKHLSNQAKQNLQLRLKMEEEILYGEKMKLRMKIFEKEENKETPNGYKDWKSFFTQFCKIENEEKAEKYSEKMIEEQFDLKNWNLLVKEDLEGIVEEEEELKRITTLISEFVLVLITWEDIFKKYNVSNEQYKLAEEELSEYEVSDLIELGEEYEFPDFLSEKIIEKIKTGIKMDKEPKRGLKMKLRLQLFEKEENKETPNGYENWDSFFKIIFGSNNEKIGNCSKMMTEEQFDLKNWNFLTNEDISFMDDSETILKFIECSASPNEGFKWRTLLIQEKLIDSHAQYKVPGEFNSWENFFRVALKDAKNVTEEEITNYSNYFDSNDFLLCHWKFLVHNKNQILKNAGVRSPYFNKIGVLIKNLKD